MRCWHVECWSTTEDDTAGAEQWSIGSILVTLVRRWLEVAGREGPPPPRLVTTAGYWDQRGGEGRRGEEGFTELHNSGEISEENSFLF